MRFSRPEHVRGRGFDGSALLPEWRSYQDARPIVAVDFRLPNPLPDQIEAQLD
jgi:hypothetical protein